MNPGATHAPVQVPKAYVDRYAAVYEKGWDAIRERTLARQKELGIVPPDTKLVPLAPGIPAWNTLTDVQKKVFARMMEVYAGFLEQTDHNAGRVIDAIEDWQLDFHLGNAVKYIARAGRKDPAKTREDLQKAIWYLQRRLEMQ
mgnify:CR=1 FL=1